jgi:hypothetical protein
MPWLRMPDPLLAGGKEALPVQYLPPADQRHCGQVFHHTHLPLQKWFLTMHLLIQGKHGISALELKQQIGMS